MPNSSNANNGIILTIPANSIWKGSVSVGATLAVSGGGSAATDYPGVIVSGDGESVANGDYICRLALFVPAVGVTALTGSQVSATMSVSDVEIQTLSTQVQLKMSFNPTGTSAVGTAIGTFL